MLWNTRKSYMKQQRAIMQIKKTMVANFLGLDVYKYSLIADNGFQVDILNYGGIITGIWTPDKNGIIENIVLSYDDINEYINNTPYFGAIVGRYAGRIDGGKFSIDGVDYQVATNNNGNSIHGGLCGLDKKFFDVEVISDGIKLSYISKELDEGFPGSIEFEISYRITGDYTLIIDSSGIPSQKTLINLTNHSYFNLSGGKTLAIYHQLMINSNKFCGVDNRCLFIGEVLEVDNTPFDFRKLKSIDRDINDIHQQLHIVGGGYDHPYILNEHTDIAAKLVDRISGRTLEVRTTSPALVLYSGNFLVPDKQVNGEYNLEKYFGICLETQNIPNAINVSSEFNQSLYSKDYPFSSKTVWKFGVKNPRESL